MVSNRYRANKSLGNKINQVVSKASKTEKSTANPHLGPDAVTGTHVANDTITTANLAPNAVTSTEIQNGSVGTNELGIVNAINSDSTLAISGAVGITLSAGNITPPGSGISRLGIDSTGTLVTSGLTPGEFKFWGGSGAMPGTLFCDGSAVSRTTYAGLFAAIGTRYGVGDGTTTFNLPDGRNAFPRGVATSAGSPTTGGSASHSHTLSSAGQAHINTTGSGTASTIEMDRQTSSSWTSNRSVTGVTSGGGSTASTLGVALDGTTDGSTTLPPFFDLGICIAY